jgi:hypothetical protein
MSQLLAEAIPLGNGIQIVSDLWGNAGGPWTIERAVRAARTQVGLPDDFRFHDLRHYFGSLLIASGRDVKVVQARLRHASAKTTLDTYGHLWPDRDDTSRAAVAAVYKERAEPRAFPRRESSSNPSRRTPTASSERAARTSSSLSRSDRSSPSTAMRPEDSLGL